MLWRAFFQDCPHVSGGHPLRLKGLKREAEQRSWTEAAQQKHGQAVGWGQFWAVQGHCWMFLRIVLPGPSTSDPRDPKTYLLGPQKQCPGTSSNTPWDPKSCSLAPKTFSWDPIELWCLDKPSPKTQHQLQCLAFCSAQAISIVFFCIFWCVFL